LGYYLESVFMNLRARTIINMGKYTGIDFENLL
jgi:hypothetical protein